MTNKKTISLLVIAAVSIGLGMSAVVPAMAAGGNDKGLKFDPTDCTIENECAVFAVGADDLCRKGNVDPNFVKYMKRTIIEKAGFEECGSGTSELDSTVLKYNPRCLTDIDGNEACSVHVAPGLETCTPDNFVTTLSKTAIDNAQLSECK